MSEPMNDKEAEYVYYWARRPGEDEHMPWEEVEPYMRDHVLKPRLSTLRERLGDRAFEQARMDFSRSRIGLEDFEVLAAFALGLLVPKSDD